MNMHNPILINREYKMYMACTYNVYTYRLILFCCSDIININGIMIYY